jgi:hypothetical protein
VGNTRAGGPIELTRLRTCKFHEIIERMDVQRRWHRDTNEVVGDPRDGHQIAQIVRKLLVDQRVDRDDSGKREQERVVVSRAEELGNSRYAVAALTIFHDNRLSPALR